MKLIKYKETKGYYLIDIKKILSKQYYKDFTKWYTGQTGMIIGMIIDEKYLVYKCDYDKWVDVHSQKMDEEMMRSMETWNMKL